MESPSTPGNDIVGSFILNGLARIVDGLNFRAVVEGIGSSERVEAKTDARDVWMQGYLYHNPVALPDAREMILV